MFEENYASVQSLKYWKTGKGKIQSLFSTFYWKSMRLHQHLKTVNTNSDIIIAKCSTCPYYYTNYLIKIGEILSLLLAARSWQLELQFSLAQTSIKALAEYLLT